MSEQSSSEPHQTRTEQEGIVRWRCLNCGQILFAAPGDDPPDTCHYCRDMTTWQPMSESSQDAAQNGNEA